MGAVTRTNIRSHRCPLCAHCNRQCSGGRQQHGQLPVGDHGCGRSTRALRHCCSDCVCAQTQGTRPRRRCCVHSTTGASGSVQSSNIPHKHHCRPPITAHCGVEGTNGSALPPATAVWRHADIRGQDMLALLGRRAAGVRSGTFVSPGALHQHQAVVDARRKGGSAPVPTACCVSITTSLWRCGQRNRCGRGCNTLDAASDAPVSGVRGPAIFLDGSRRRIGATRQWRQWRSQGAWEYRHGCSQRQAGPSV